MEHRLTDPSSPHGPSPAPQHSPAPAPALTPGPADHAAIPPSPPHPHAHPHTQLPSYPLPPPTPTPVQIQQQQHSHWPAPPPAPTTVATVSASKVSNEHQLLALYYFSANQFAAGHHQFFSSANDVAALVQSKNLELQAKDHQIAHLHNQLAHHQQLLQAANEQVDTRIQAAVAEALALASATPAPPQAVDHSKHGPEVSRCSSCALQQSHVASLVKELADVKSSNTELQAKWEKLRSDNKNIKSVAQKYRTRAHAYANKVQSIEAIRTTIAQQSAAFETANKDLGARLDAAEALANDLDGKLKEQEAVNIELEAQLHAFARQAGLAVSIAIANKALADRRPNADPAARGHVEETVPQPQQPPAATPASKGPEMPTPAAIASPSTTTAASDPVPRPDFIIVDDSPMTHPAPLHPLTSSALPNLQPPPPAAADAPAPASSQTQDTTTHDIRSPASDQPVQHDATNLAPPARPFSPIDVSSSPLISNMEFDDMDMDVDPAALATSSDEMDIVAAAADSSDDVETSRRLRQATLTQMQRDWVAGKPPAAAGGGSPGKCKRRREPVDALQLGEAIVPAPSAAAAATATTAKQVARELDATRPESPSSAKKRRTVEPLVPSAPGLVPVKVEKEYMSRGFPKSTTSASRHVTIVEPPQQRRSVSPAASHAPSASTSPAAATPRPCRSLTFGPTTSASTTPKQAPTIKYNPVVRSKEARKSMHGTDCPCCKPFFDAAYPDPEVAAQRIQQVSRHRSMHQVSSTPDGFWDIGFPETQEEERERREREEEGRRARSRPSARASASGGNLDGDNRASNEPRRESSENGESEVGLGPLPPDAGVPRTPAAATPLFTDALPRRSKTSATPPQRQGGLTATKPTVYVARKGTNMF